MKQRVLFLTTNLPGGSAIADVKKYRDSIKHIVELFNKDKYLLSIKLHPSEEIEYYNILLNDFTDSITIIQKCDLYEIINANDIIIGFPTTALLEAKNLGKNCYYINPWKTDLPFPFDVKKDFNFGSNILIELKDASYFSETSKDISEVISIILNRINNFLF